VALGMTEAIEGMMDDAIVEYEPIEEDLDSDEE
jgi:hypothetical protein